MRLPEGMSKPTVFSALFHGSILAAFLFAWPKEPPRPADADMADSIAVMIVGGGVPAASAPSTPTPSPSDSETADRKSAPPAPRTGNAAGEMALDETDFADEPEPKPMTMAELPLEAMPEPPPPIEEALEIQRIVEKPAAEKQQAVQKPKPLPAMKPTPPREATTKPAPPQPLERQLASLLAANTAVTEAPASTAATSAATEGHGSSDTSSPSRIASLETGANADTPAGSSVTPGPSAAEQADYASLLAAWLDRHKEYPDRARRKHQEGVVLCEFAIDREGHVLRYRIVQGSGYTLLDEEASDLMARANPVPPPPLGMDQTYLVPIVFALN